MPVPLVGIAVAAAARLAAKKLAQEAAKKTVKATVKKKVVSAKRQAFDGPVSRSSAKDVIPKMGRNNLQISKNVAIKNAKSPSGKVSIRGGAGQVMSQNVRSTIKMNKPEAKANARGLKAAKKPTNKTGSKADRAQRADLINQSNLIKNASPARANRTRGGSLYAIKTYGGQGLVSAKKTPKQIARQAEITKEMNPVRKKKFK
jgi:hypothetical protein